MENFYELLGVEENATPAQIKVAYRKMAMRHHPDRNNNSKEAEETFKKIKEAYETLSNSSAKFWYDKEYNDFKKYHKEQYTNNKSDNKSGFEHDYENKKSDNDYKENKKSESYFSDNGKYYRDPNISVDIINKYPFSNLHYYLLKISFSEYKTGVEKEFPFYITKNGFVTIKINVPSNSRKNECVEVVISKEDILFVFVEVEKSPTADLDIFSEIEIDIFTAILGTKVKLLTSAGGKELTIPALTKDGDNLVFYGYGRKNGLFQGDLYVKVNVLYPTKLTDEQILLLSSLSNIQIDRNKSFFNKMKNVFKKN